MLLGGKRRSGRRPGGSTGQSGWSPCARRHDPTALSSEPEELFPPLSELGQSVERLRLFRVWNATADCRARWRGSLDDSAPRILGAHAKRGVRVNQPTRPPLSELLGNTELFTNALTRAAREAVLRSAKAGVAVPTLRDGKVVWLSPEEALALLDL